jgi:PleD family two-component response regulator
MDELLADPRGFDMIFVESTARAYARIKELRPDLVVLFAAPDDQESFQLLSVLALDRETREIPIVTYGPPREARGVRGVVADIGRRVSIAVPDPLN